MPERDNFPPQVIEMLKAGAGSKCSRPTCRAATSGPSNSRASGGSNVGVDAHITGARPKAARYDRHLTPQQRKSYANGIWLCQNDAKLIDDDEERHTKELLVAWREAAEKLARSELGVPARLGVDTRNLVKFSRVLGEIASLRERVHQFLVDVGAPVAWGEHYHLVRSVIYEVALNAFGHGGATQVILESQGASVIVRDRGQAFGLAQLRRSGKGGNRAVLDLERDAAGTFSLRYRSGSDFNEW